jgi:DNA-binding CsgD family transcriptional regulator
MAEVVSLSGIPNMPKSAEQLVLEKLDQLLRVLTISVTSGLKQKDQIALLDRAGFSPKDIAGLLGTTRNTVNVALNAIRKGRASGSKQ